LELPCNSKAQKHHGVFYVSKKLIKEKTIRNTINTKKNQQKTKIIREGRHC
tara:strand:+ start:721 stop:873 length:153 start_codon:yes stop_codon:yes gene_type:complete